MLKNRIDILNMLNRTCEVRSIDKGYESVYSKPVLSYLKDGKMVTDSCYSSSFPYTDEYQYTVIADNRRKSFQYLSTLVQNGIISSIVDTLSSEATKSPIVLVNKSSEEYIDEQEYINKRLKELDIYTVMRTALKSNYIFGGCTIFFEINYNHSSDHLEIPLLLSPLTINKEKKITQLTVVDPIYCVPIEINTINPLDKTFYIPSIYSVMGRSVHHTRLYRMVTNEVPDNIKPMYNFFGISLVQQCEEYVYRFEVITENINAIIKRMRTSIFSTEMSALLTNDCTADELSLIKSSLNTRYSMLESGNNNSMIFLDKELEDFREINTSLSGLSDLLSSISEQVCIVPKIPATKLLGISPKGMNATGESDMNNFYDEIKKIQNNYLVPFVQKVVDILYMELTGKKNSSICVEFENINQQAMLDSQVEASFVNDTIRSVEVGIITESEARQRLSERGWTLDIGDHDDSQELDILNNMIENNENE